MAILKNTTISGTSNLKLPTGTTSQRPGTTGRQVVTLTTASTSPWTVPAGVTSIQVLCVGGGGAGGFQIGGGGGGGGVVYTEMYGPVTPGGTIAFSVGAGGTPDNSAGYNRAGSGGNTTFGSITAYGGGGGGSNGTGGYLTSGGTGGTGGSCGGNGEGNTIVYPTNYPNCQGNVGGTAMNAIPYPSGGGGGAGQPGGNGIASNGNSGGSAGGGGAGLPFNISGTTVWYGGGGGGGAYMSTYLMTGGAGGLGGGGRAGISGSRNGVAGTANTGGGGGAGSYDGNDGQGAAGGSGVIVISYILDTDQGYIRHNSEANIIEISEENESWKAIDPRYNFGGHNLCIYSEQF